MSDLQSELHHLEATNRSMAWQFRSLARAGKLTPDLAREIVSASNENFRHRSVTIWDGDQGYLLAESARDAAAPIKPSPAFNSDFAGFVLDQDRLQLRVIKRFTEGNHHLTVISNLPVTPDLLRKSTSELGSITLSPDLGSGVRYVQSSGTSQSSSDQPASREPS